MRQTLSPAPTPARASPAAWRALCSQRRRYVTVSPYRWKYGASGVSAARRRISSVSVVAAFTSSAVIVVVLEFGGDPPALRPRAERGRGRVGVAVSQIDDPDGVAGLLAAQHGPEVVEAVHRGAAEADDHVALAEPRRRRAAAGHDAADAQPVAGAGLRDDDAEERAAHGRPLRRALPGRGDARVRGTRAAREALDRRRGDPLDLRHRVGVELVGGVARRVVIGVGARREEKDPHARLVKQALARSTPA